MEYPFIYPIFRPKQLEVNVSYFRGLCAPTFKNITFKHGHNVDLEGGGGGGLPNIQVYKIQDLCHRRNIMSQKKFYSKEPKSCHKKKLTVTHRKKYTDQRKKFTFAGRNFLLQEEIYRHRKKYNIIG